MADSIKNTCADSAVHPLKLSEESYRNTGLERDLAMLSRYEGTAAPMRIMMEMKAFQQVGRLPFLPSSRVHLDVITGRDELIDFSDFLGNEEFAEKLYQPHAVVEKQLKLWVLACDRRRNIFVLFLFNW